jgi:anti-anti-sigma factor
MNDDGPPLPRPERSPGSGPDPASDRFTMHAQRDESGRRLSLWLTGEIDAAERDVIVAELDAGEPPTEITIEMSGVGYIGSAGLSALIHACRQLEPHDHKVVLLDPSAPVIRLLDTCRLTRQFTLQLT